MIGIIIAILTLIGVLFADFCIYSINGKGVIPKVDYEKEETERVLLERKQIKEAVKEVYDNTPRINGMAYNYTLENYSYPYKITFSWRDDGLYTNKPVTQANKDYARREMESKLKDKGFKSKDFIIVN